MRRMVYQMMAWAAVATVAFAGFGCGSSDSVANGPNCVETNGGVEQCDGIDNNCDGQTDEALDPRACESNGQTGQQTCTAGAWGECQVEGPPPAETCNNLDDDGDGQTDEDLERDCESDCGDGVETCEAGEWTDCTAPEPAAEICDNQDNDCDGQTDESLTQGCTNDCGDGTQTCAAGVWGACDAPEPEAEACDNQDNDCDGQTDESLTQGCTNDCGDGTQTCAAGVWGACDAPAPEAELCDGLDNDCDGDFDEDVQRACNTACGSGVQACLGDNEWGPCDAPAPAAEVCDGDDNDCDGQIDEGLSRACETLCGNGQETCSLGNWVGCTAPRPTAETCDNQDNDCDGSTDEDLSRPCSSACGPGEETCNRGQWAACNAPTPAATDTCGDLRDNDCDGDTDEGCACTPTSTTVCGVTQGVCVQGVSTCSAQGAWGPCLQGGSPVILPGQIPESCDDTDNDCDGDTDETFPGAGDVCGTDEGECTAGRKACVDGDEICQGEVPGGDEICDGLDNNCDGDVDEGLAGDLYESNETCGSAEYMNTVTEGSDARLWTATLYPTGDVDNYLIDVLEGFSLCNPFTGDPPDDDYTLYVALDNVPEGVDYDLCIVGAWVDGQPSEFCTQEFVIEEYCVTEAVDGMKAVAIDVDCTCMISDDLRIQVIVRPHDGSGVSCLPYSLAVWAETIPLPEE